MKSCQSHKLELVSHARQFRLKARNGELAQILAPVKARGAVIRQHLLGKFRVNGLGKLPRLLETGMRSLAPDQIGKRRISQSTRDRRRDPAANPEESLRRALARAEFTITRVDVTGQQLRAVGVGAPHNER